MAEDVVHCRHCGVEIREINWALGKEWNHSTYPYRPREAYRVCQARTVAEPPVPAADRQTDEERCRYVAEHHLMVSCGSCGFWQPEIRPAARPADADERMAQLRDEVDAGVRRALLRDAVAGWLWCGIGPWERAADFDREQYRQMADSMLALPEVAALLDAADKVRRVEALAKRATVSEHAHTPISVPGLRAALRGVP